jgi:hypothetical protein
MRVSATGRRRSARGHGAYAGQGDRGAMRGTLFAIAATLAVALAATASVGCGNSAQRDEARGLESASILSDTAPLEKRLTKQSEISGASDTAAQRTFLQLWSTLQFGAWDRAEQFFQPGLRDAIGPALLARALGQYVLIWQGTKPRIVTAKVSGDTATIAFLTRDEKDHVVPASISFTRSNGAWLVSYFSVLDGALQRAVQLSVQAELEPLGTKASPQAVRKGDEAATLQSTYLERQLHPPAATRKAGGGAGRR